MNTFSKAGMEAKATALADFGQEWTAGFLARSRPLFPDLGDKLLRKVSQSTVGDPVAGVEAIGFWDGPIPAAELPDPPWTVDGRYNVLTGGARPGGAVNILWERIHAEVEEGNQQALALERPVV